MQLDGRKGAGTRHGEFNGSGRSAGTRVSRDTEETPRETAATLSGRVHTGCVVRCVHVSQAAFTLHASYAASLQCKSMGVGSHWVRPGCICTGRAVRCLPVQGNVQALHGLLLVTKSPGTQHPLVQPQSICSCRNTLTLGAGATTSIGWRRDAACV